MGEFRSSPRCTLAYLQMSLAAMRRTRFLSNQARSDSELSGTERGTTLNDLPELRLLDSSQPCGRSNWNCLDASSAIRFRSDNVPTFGLHSAVMAEGGNKNWSQVGLTADLGKKVPLVSMYVHSCD